MNFVILKNNFYVYKEHNWYNFPLCDSSEKYDRNPINLFLIPLVRLDD